MKNGIALWSWIANLLRSHFEGLLFDAVRLTKCVSFCYQLYGLYGVSPRLSALISPSILLSYHQQSFLPKGSHYLNNKPLKCIGFDLIFLHKTLVNTSPQILWYFSYWDPIAAEMFRSSPWRLAQENEIFRILTSKMFRGLSVEDRGGRSQWNFCCRTKPVRLVKLGMIRERGCT